MEKIKNKRLQIIILFILSLLFFGIMASIRGIGEYGDSGQYLTMHIHREPLYPLWLYMIKMFSGKNIEAGILLGQCLLAAVCTTYYCSYIITRFKLKIMGGMVIWGITLVPHIITPLISESGLILTSAILSEAICLPLFLVFLVECHKIMVDNVKRAVMVSFFLSLLLSLCRGQMMFTIVLWIMIVMSKCILERKFSYIVVSLVMVILFFAIRGYTIKSYNFIFNDRFIGNTYGQVNTLTHVMYASKREMGEAIEQKEIRELFYAIYDKMEEKGLNDKKDIHSVWEKAIKLEEIHDTLKFDVVESVLNDYFKEQGIDDYIERNLYSDEYASVMIRRILPQCLLEWLCNYFMLAFRGVIRTVAVVNPIFTTYAVGLLVYLSIDGIMIIKNQRRSSLGWLMMISVLTVLGLAFSTAFTIMCLSRYMIYGFTGIYTCVALKGSEKLNEYMNNVDRSINEKTGQTGTID